MRAAAHAPLTDMLFADCLKIAFDLLPADHKHKESFMKFMLEVRARARARASHSMLYST